MVIPFPSKFKADPVLLSAIEQRKLIKLRYKNRVRIMEPHDYGVHRGTVKLLAYQIGGESNHKLPNWRWIETAEISDLELLDVKFAGGRQANANAHHKWDHLFARVETAKQQKA